MLSLDLFEPPGRLQQEPHLPVLLKLLLMLSQPLLSASPPRREPPGPAAVRFVRRVIPAQFSLGVSPPARDPAPPGPALGGPGRKLTAQSPLSVPGDQPRQGPRLDFAG